MASRGDVTTKVGFRVGNTSKPVLVVPSVEDLSECCYINPVFGNVDYLTEPDDFKEDYTSYFNYYDQNAITAVVLEIQKCESGAFIDKHTITDNTYGEFVALGDEVHDELNYTYIRNLNWSKILDDFGAGIYRIKTIETDIFTDVNNAYSLTYDLKAFTADRANGTVRFKIENTGVLGDANNAQKKFTFPDNWVDQFRVEGTYGQDFSELIKESTIFNDGFKEYIKTEREDKGKFHSERISEAPRTYFKNELMMANLVMVTNYGRNLANTHIDTPLHSSGEFSPVYTNQSALAGFEVEFTDAYANQEKLHC